MKLIRNNEGTYSIVDMTREDFSKISFGECSAAAFVTQPFPGEDDETRAWSEAEKHSASRLYSAMEALMRAAGSGSITLTSAQGYGDRDAMYVEKISKVIGWRDENGVPEDVTSHLQKKGA